MIGRVKSVGAAIAACGIALAIGSPLAAFAQDEQTNQSSGEQTGHHHHGHHHHHHHDADQNE